MVTISLNRSAAGSWHVCRSQVALFSDLQLGSAIRLARAVARDEHQRLGHQVCVKMPGLSSMIVLARYVGSDGAGAGGTMTA